MYLVRHGYFRCHDKMAVTPFCRHSQKHTAGKFHGSVGTSYIAVLRDKIVVKDERSVLTTINEDVITGSASRCTVVRPMRKSIGKWEI